MTDRIAILHAPGTNRDGEAARAIELAGGAAEIVMVGEPLDRFAGVVVPGGFSHGDALGAGRRMALDCGDALATVAGSGRPVLGICNGFQVLVRAGLLPGGGRRDVTLTHNATGRFVCRWVTLAFPADSRAAPWLGEREVRCPVAHGEGRIAVGRDEVIEELAAAGQVLCRYVGGTNPNGSAGDVAGLCDPTGTVWGLMPHPEDHLVAAQDAFGDLGGAGAGQRGLPLFEAFVRRARER